MNGKDESCNSGIPQPIGETTESDKHSDRLKGYSKLSIHAYTNGTTANEWKSYVVSERVSDE